MIIRQVAAADLPDLCQLEAVPDAPAYAAVGLAELIRQWRCFPAGALLAVADGQSMGALLSARVSDTAAMALSTWQGHAGGWPRAVVLACAGGPQCPL